MPESIYLDNNATTPLAPEAAEAMERAAKECWGNPSSQHRFGRRARQVLEDAREAIGTLLGANLGGFPPDRVIFTSGGTEANNLAMFGLASASPGHLVISDIEHPSVSGPAEVLAGRGWQVDKLPVGADGQVIVDELPRLLRPNTRLVAVMLGNNETGIMQPLERIAAIATEAGVPVHTDAVQPVAKLPVNFRQLGVTTLTATAHKFHGPIGVGVLIVRAGVELPPQFFGGHQQEGFRPGTEPVVLAAGMARHSKPGIAKVTTAGDDCNRCVMNSKRCCWLNFLNWLSTDATPSGCRTRRTWPFLASKDNRWAWPSTWPAWPVRPVRRVPAGRQNPRRFCWQWASPSRWQRRVCGSVLGLNRPWPRCWKPFIGFLWRIRICGDRNSREIPPPPVAYRSQIRYNRRFGKQAIFAV